MSSKSFGSLARVIWRISSPSALRFQSSAFKCGALLFLRATLLAALMFHLPSVRTQSGNNTQFLFLTLVPGGPDGHILCAEYVHHLDGSAERELVVHVVVRRLQRQHEHYLRILDHREHDGNGNVHGESFCDGATRFTEWPSGQHVHIRDHYVRLQRDPNPDGGLLDSRRYLHDRRPHAGSDDHELELGHLAGI